MFQEDIEFHEQVEINKDVTVNANVAVNGVLSNSNGNVKPYKSYVAILNQSGTGAPTVTVLENTLGATLTPSRAGVGSYLLTPNVAGLFTTAKTITFPSPSVNKGFVSFYVDQDNNRIAIYTKGEDFQPAHDILNQSPIEIRVYN